MEESMSEWRNVTCPDGGPDAEMRRIDEMKDALADLPAEVERVRALISRFDSVAHYRAFDNLAFLLDAVGSKTYPGSPAVDVLAREWEIDDDRRDRIKGYARAIGEWIEGRSLDKAIDALPKCEEQCREAYEALGVRDEQKLWLAASLAKTLKAHVSTPEDGIDEFADGEFVCGVYEVVLGRPPSPDDLSFRLAELKAGKTRTAFVKEISESNECQSRLTQEVVGHLAHS
jgi:hypothetical protein